MSDLLLDSHVMLWFFWDDPSLNPAAKSIIEDASNRKLVSIATCWEISIKAGLGKLKLGESAATFLARHIPLNNFELLPIELRHVTHVETLPSNHRDPFDRLLVAQALTENISIISADPIFEKYGVQRL